MAQGKTLQATLYTQRIRAQRICPNRLTLRLDRKERHPPDYGQPIDDGGLKSSQRLRGNSAQK